MKDRLENLEAKLSKVAEAIVSRPSIDTVLVVCGEGLPPDRIEIWLFSSNTLDTSQALDLQIVKSISAKEIGADFVSFAEREGVEVSQKSWGTFGRKLERELRSLLRSNSAVNELRSQVGFYTSMAGILSFANNVKHLVGSKSLALACRNVSPKIALERFANKFGFDPCSLFIVKSGKVKELVLLDEGYSKSFASDLEKLFPMLENMGLKTLLITENVEERLGIASAISKFVPKIKIRKLNEMQIEKLDAKWEKDFAENKFEWLQ